MSRFWPTIWTGVVALIAFVASYGGVEALRAWAARGNALDIPNPRSSHTRPTPRGGGLAIVVCTLIGLWVLSLSLRNVLDLRMTIGYSLGAILIAAVSWRDDLEPVSNRVRFGAHVAGALIVLFTVGWWEQVTLPLLPSFSLGLLGSVITLFWIVGLINVYNFMDGIDGLAGGQAVIGGVAWAVLGWWFNQWLVAILGILVAAASVGFLLHNWPPARIFMGDVGSAFLGFTFAVLAVIAGFADPRLALVGVVLLWPFVFDTSYTLLNRLRKGENIFQAHRSHLYQRLVIAGHTHRSVTLLYLVMMLVSASCAMLWLVVPLIGTCSLVLWLPLSVAGTWAYVRRVEAILRQAPTVTAGTSSSASDIG